MNTVSIHEASEYGWQILYTSSFRGWFESVFMYELNILRNRAYLFMHEKGETGCDVGFSSTLFPKNSSPDITFVLL